MKVMAFPCLLTRNYGEHFVECYEFQRAIPIFINQKEHSMNTIPLVLKQEQVEGLPGLVKLVHQIRWAVIILSVVVGVAIGVMLTAPVAHADTTTDQEYIATLTIGGITFNGNISDEIRAGHEICQYRDAGYSDNEVEQHMLAPGNISPFQAGYIVGAAESAYCPEYANDSGDVHRPPKTGVVA